MRHIIRPSSREHCPSVAKNYSGAAVAFWLLNLRSVRVDWTRGRGTVRGLALGRRAPCRRSALRRQSRRRLRGPIECATVHDDEYHPQQRLLGTRGVHGAAWNRRAKEGRKPAGARNVRSATPTAGRLRRTHHAPAEHSVPRCAGWAVSVGSEVVFVVDSLEGAVDLLVKFIHDPLALPLLLVVGISGQVALEVVHVAVQSVKPNPLP